MSYATTVSRIVEKRFTEKAAGIHGDTHAASGLDAIPDRGLARKQLEYPLENVSFAWLGAIGECRSQRVWDNNGFSLVANKIFTDKAIEAFGLGIDTDFAVGRVKKFDTYYSTFYDDDYSTSDVRLYKTVNGQSSLLGYEAVDVGRYDTYLQKLSCSGTAINLFREDMVTPKVAATDTSISEGYFGCCVPRHDIIRSNSCVTYLRPSSTPVLPIIKYFSLPIMGFGTREDPFRAEFPMKIISHPIWKNIDELSLINSAIIKTDKDGKPTDGEAIVRIFKQYNRPEYLKSESECINELRRMRGVKELSREEAIRQAKKKDDKLHDLDLRDASELRKDTQTAKRDYISWREKTLEVKRELIDDDAMGRYVQERNW